MSATFLQPFLTYTTPGATTFALNSESTYDWESEEWSIPVNFQVNQLIDVAGQKIQIGAGIRYWVDSRWVRRPSQPRIPVPEVYLLRRLDQTGRKLR